MSLSKTEKILWTIYDLIETAKRVDDHIARSWHQLLYPEYYQLMNRLRYRRGRKEFSNFISYLKKKGFIKTRIEKNKKAIILTPKGKERILKIELKNIKKKRRGDKKWVMIIFDIPEKKHKIRDYFRTDLKILGYQKLQQSIWICPYDVVKETEKLIRLHFLEENTKILLVEELEIKK